MREFIITLEREFGTMFMVRCDSFKLTTDYIFFKKDNENICSVNLHELFSIHEIIDCKSVKVEL